MKEVWFKRFIASEPRLSEAVEMYQEAGFEVHLVPLPKGSSCDDCAGSEEGEECRICYEGSEHLYKIIYTRLKEGGEGDDF